jgi:ketosteroid isomerase-like protein
MEIETDTVEAYGDRVLAVGSWRTTGRVSGVEETLPSQIVYTVRDGRIIRLEWFADHDAAVAAARGD